MPPKRYSRHVRAVARPDIDDKLVLGVRERVAVAAADDDIYVLTIENDTPSSIAARAWPSLRVTANSSPTRPEGFSPAELWWVILDLIDQDDPLVPITGGQRLRLPSADRVRRELIS